jgi:hypothetical protein
MSDRVAAEILCRTGTSDHQITGKDFFGRATGVSYKVHYRVTTVYLSCPLHPWTRIEKFSCPVCGDPLTLKISNGKARSLKAMIVAWVVAAFGVCVGIQHLPANPYEKFAWVVFYDIGFPLLGIVFSVRFLRQLYGFGKRLPGRARLIRDKGGSLFWQGSDVQHKLKGPGY